MKPKVIRNENHSGYYVEVHAPGSGARDGWGRFDLRAFTDIRCPGRGAVNSFPTLNPDVFEVKERLNITTCAAFTTLEAAWAYALRLEEFGRWAHGWEGIESWRREKREQPLVCRVTFEESSLKVTAMPHPITYPKALADELRLGLENIEGDPLPISREMVGRIVKALQGTKS